MKHWKRCVGCTTRIALVSHFDLCKDCRRKNDRLARIAVGLCARPGCVNLATSTACECERCLARTRARQVERKRQYRKEGRCVKCGQPATKRARESGFTRFCKKCSKQNTVYQSRYVRKRRLAKRLESS